MKGARNRFPYFLLWSQRCPSDIPIATGGVLLLGACRGLALGGKTTLTIQKPEACWQASRARVRTSGQRRLPDTMVPPDVWWATFRLFGVFTATHERAGWSIKLTWTRGQIKRVAAGSGSTIDSLKQLFTASNRGDSAVMIDALHSTWL